MPTFGNEEHNPQMIGEEEAIFDMNQGSILDNQAALESVEDIPTSNND